MNIKSNFSISSRPKSIHDSLYGKGRKVEDNVFVKNHIRHFFSKEYMKEKLEKFNIIKVRKNSSKYHGSKSAFIEGVDCK